MGLEIPARSPVLERGTIEFQKMLDHFSGNKIPIHSIHAEWVYGDNLAEVNRLTGAMKRLSGEKAVAKAAPLTWTGQQAIKSGFTKIKVIAVDGKNGNFSRVEVLFSKE